MLSLRLSSHITYIHRHIYIYTHIYIYKTKKKKQRDSQPDDRGMRELEAVEE